MATLEGTAMLARDGHRMFMEESARFLSSPAPGDPTHLYAFAADIVDAYTAIRSRLSPGQVIGAEETLHTRAIPFHGALLRIGEATASTADATRVAGAFREAVVAYTKAAIEVRDSLPNDQIAFSTLAHDNSYTNSRELMGRWNLHETYDQIKGPDMDAIANAVTMLSHAYTNAASGNFDAVRVLNTGIEAIDAQLKRRLAQLAFRDDEDFGTRKSIESAIKIAGRITSEARTYRISEL